LPQNEHFPQLVNPPTTADLAAGDFILHS
jgi:hypothetical protein